MRDVNCCFSSFVSDINDEDTEDDNDNVVHNNTDDDDDGDYDSNNK